MGKIKRKKLSSFETKTLSELKEINDGGDKVYVPYIQIQPAYDNYKHEISECPQKLSVGENVQITDEGIVNAVDTRYIAGDNIKIDSEGKISYVGDEPQTYAAGKGLRQFISVCFSNSVVNRSRASKASVSTHSVWLTIASKSRNWLTLACKWLS